MKAGIFDPYLDTVGGGERYCLTLAETLLQKGWQVDLFWPDEKIREGLSRKFSLSTDRVNFVPYSIRANNLLGRWKFEKDYDLLFYVSDGSLPFMFGKKNLLHFQVPFKNIAGIKIINSFKLKNQILVSNSFFTKNVIDSALGTKSTVLYPPIATDLFRPLTKEKIILSVGRFSQLLQGKRQDVLLETFKEMWKKGLLDGWKLILAGGNEVGGKEYVNTLREKANSLPVEIIENPGFNELAALYGRAKIFWTASGYGIDEQKEPEKVEHFGITTVEAMAAGCAPVVLAKGGQKEIVEDGLSGFWWQEKKELSEKTQRLIKEPKLLNKIVKNARLRSRRFSKAEFCQQLNQLLSR